MSAFADTVPVLLPMPLAGALDYRVPPDITLSPGDFVRVPLGSRTVQGVVWSTAPSPNLDSDKLKFILEKQDIPALPPSLMTFIDWVAAYSMARPGAVLKMAMTVPKNFKPPRMETWWALAPDAVHAPRLSKARKAVVALGQTLPTALPLKAAVWAEQAGVSVGVIRAMTRAGLLIPVSKTENSPKNTTENKPETQPSQNPPQLSLEQQKAADHLVAMVTARHFQTVLLEGITGSGKTEVYFEAIAAALSETTVQILVLLPEIALTTQFLERFEQRFGSRPVVWHSELTPTRRRQAWQRIASGTTRVVVGARSALFLPFPTLGLVVVDEEHSPSFKQEDGVIYHGRDMAVVRGMQADCPVILASATPSLETLLNAEAGKYDWLYLGERHGVANLPAMTALDLRQHRLKNGTWLSDPLRQALQDNLKRGEQSLLYLNRRGYAPLTLCRGCGHRMTCPHCTAWLVAHKQKDRLICHHCGFSCPTPVQCPTCKTADSMVACGPGVERLAEEVENLLPEARLAVMASDAAPSPAAMRALIDQISDHAVDIIIGTQIVTKGHHFPMLTLVGVVDADLGLSGGDPRAAERTWQQLEQVSGRAGRADHPGQVLFQTYNPDHPVLQALLSGDAQAFLIAEAAARKQQNLPPYGKLAGIVIAGADKTAVTRTARNLAAQAPKKAGLTILGPTPAPMAWLRGRHRYRLLVKATKTIKLQAVLRHWLDHCPPERGVTIQVDIDPYTFL